MRLKPFLVVSMIAFIISACGISPQYHPILDDPTATPELVYIEEATPEALPSPYPQVLPAINPTFTAFSVHIQAVFLANDDGSDRSTIATGSDHALGRPGKPDIFSGEPSILF